MKKFILFVILTMSFYSDIFAQVGIGTSTPHSSAQLELNSANKGFLPTRIALQGIDIAAPISTPASGLLVYNTATAGISPFNVVPGYYYWTGAYWSPVNNSANVYGDMQYWDGTKWIIIPIGNEGENLTVCNGKPVWGSCQKTLVLQPSNNLYEGVINVFYPNIWLGNISQLLAEAWTSGGNAFTARSLIKFDYSSVISGAIIDSAKLMLYADPTPSNGNSVDAHFGPSNSYYIQRITSAWTTPNQHTWNTPPTAVTTNQVIVPQSTSSFQDANIDVTLLVKDQFTNGNNGFFIKLTNEVTYNIRQYCSSNDTDATKHPKLIIYYHY